MRHLRVLFAVCVALLALAPTASAHLIFVDPAGQGNGTVRWVGGGGAAHGTGLVHACLVAMGNESGVVTFMAPPFPTFTPTSPLHCVHGHGEQH